jgi:hypothetical protein
MIYYISYDNCMESVTWMYYDMIFNTVIVIPDILV